MRRRPMPAAAPPAIIPKAIAAVPIGLNVCLVYSGRHAEPAARLGFSQPKISAAKLGLGDALATLRIEEMQGRGIGCEAPFLARPGLHMAALAHSDELARLAETAMQQRVGAQRLGHLDFELKRPVAGGQQMLGPHAERHGRTGRRAGGLTQPEPNASPAA